LRDDARLPGWLCCVTAALLGLSVATVALGMPVDENEDTSVLNSRGYDRNSLFVAIDGPEINAFSFNFVVRFPLAIGLKYPENAGLDLQPNLTYSSRVTHFQSRDHKHQFFRIRRQNPFGLGFDLSLGRIVGRQRWDDVDYSTLGHWQFIDSSGAGHALKLQQTGANGDEWRTHDGSHIRAVYFNNKWTVSFTSGVTLELGHRVGSSGPPLTEISDLRWGDWRDTCEPSDGVPCEAQWDIPDPVGGWQGFDRDFVGWHTTKVWTKAATSATPQSYTIEYFGDDGATADAKYAHIIRYIRDQFNRMIEFQIDHSLGLVNRILTPAPGTAGNAPADYLLEYQSRTLDSPADGSVHHQVWVLTKLSGPQLQDGGRYVHAFDYKPSGGGDVGGQLAQVTYPSGPLVKIAYQEYSYLNGGPGHCMGFDGSNDPRLCNAFTHGGTCNWSWGVSRIDKFLDGTTNSWPTGNQRTTTFSQSQTDWDWQPSDPPGSCSEGTGGYQKKDQIHTMIDPAGNKTELRFRTSKELADDSLTGLLLSQKVYGGTSSTVLRDTDYQYELLDSMLGGFRDNSYEMGTKQVKTFFLDDPLPNPTVMVEDRSLSDGFGHYQRSVFSGTEVGDEAKVVITDYASDNTQCGYASPLQDNWLGDVIAREETRKLTGSPQMEAGVSRTDYGFDTTSGLRGTAIGRSDVNNGASVCTNPPLPSGGDEGTEYSYTTMGDLHIRRRYLQGANGLDGPDFLTTYTFKYGTRESAQQNSLTYLDYFRLIDQASGLVTEERSHPTSSTDTTAPKTTFSYDIVGRTKSIAHGTDLPLLIQYENEQSAGSDRLARARATQGTSTAQTESVDHFVSGRLDHEEKLMPDGGRAFRYTSYDAFGRVSMVSEWTRQSTASGVPGTTTGYGVFDVGGSHLYEDPFARPTSVTDALGNVTKYAYFGTNKRITTQGVALKSNNLADVADVVTTYYTDGLGRLRLVTKPTGGDATNFDSGAAARYSYDVLGHLLVADVAPNLAVTPTSSDRFAGGGPGTQSRSFGYDNLGRLTSTTTPEAGTVTNLAWNALGQVAETQDALGAAWGHKHRTTYDGAGRPTLLERVTTSGLSLNYDKVAGTAASTGWTIGAGWRYDSVGSCLQQPTGTNHPSWYIGTTSCQYAQSGAGLHNAYLDSPSIDLPSSAVVTFKYFREVRGDGGNHDRLRVLVQDQGDTSHTWHEIYRLESTQVSWKRWMQSPALPLQSWGSKTVIIRFEFDTVDNAVVTNVRGIGISEVLVRRPSALTLQATTYDEPFGLSRGKPTTIKQYDEATLAPIFTRELHYSDPNGRLSDEKLTFDWDRDGTSQTLVDDYGYDTRGDLVVQHLPHPVNTTTRRYEFASAHGTLSGIQSLDEGSGIRQYYTANSALSGIEYNDAGGMSLIRYGNDLQEHIQANAAFAPNRMWVDRGSGTTALFDTGQYLYDGARNLKQIGQDYFRYDPAMRLTWARVTSSLYNTVDLDQAYDAYGNMTDQLATRSGGGTNDLPYGLAFSGRAYSNNRITNTGFSYDANGDLIDEPGHDNLAPQSYNFSPEGTLARITDGNGMTFQSANYEGDDHRWYRSTWADGAKALVTVRDASGQVAADFLESNATSGLVLQKEYVHVNGQLLAINSTCGPRPALALSTPATQGTNVWFDRTDYNVVAVGQFTVYIETSDGQWKVISEPSSLATHFSLAQSDLFPDVTNWIQIETSAACGHTGYSNAVSYSYSTLTPQNGGTCLPSLGANRSGFNGSGSNLALGAQNSCPTGTTFNFYYQRVGTSDVIRVNPIQPLTATSISISGLPCGSGEGDYWLNPILPGTGGVEGTPSPRVAIGATSCGGNGGGGGSSQPGQPGMNAQYIHWDHLGSTRVMTDEQGVTIAAFKYYPFGMEAEYAGGDELRHKFTGQERDDRVGLDYMMARSTRSSLGAFLGPDSGGADRAEPSSWNRYAYVRHNPLAFRDPSGRTVESALNQVNDYSAMIRFVSQHVTEGRVSAVEIARVIYQENRNDHNWIRDDDATSAPLSLLTLGAGGPEMKNFGAGIGLALFGRMSGTFGIGEMKVSTAATLVGLDSKTMNAGQLHQVLVLLGDPFQSIQLIALYLDKLKKENPDATDEELLQLYNSGVKGPIEPDSVAARSAAVLPSITEFVTHGPDPQGVVICNGGFHFQRDCPK
jgi:RHS repeat-associated protein